MCVLLCCIYVCIIVHAICHCFPLFLKRKVRWMRDSDPPLKWKVGWFNVFPTHQPHSAGCHEYSHWIDSLSVWKASAIKDQAFHTKPPLTFAVVCLFESTLILTSPLTRFWIGLHWNALSMLIFIHPYSDQISTGMSLQVYGINVWLSKATHRHCTQPALLYWLIFKVLLAAPKLQTTNESGGFLCTSAPTCEGTTLDKGLDGNMQDLLNLTKSVLDYNRWLQLQMTYMNHACIAQQRLTISTSSEKVGWLHY